MDFKRIMIYSDVDGTITNTVDGVSVVSPHNIEAASNFITAGGKLGVASGRSHFTVDELFSGLSFNLPYIEANGASIWDKDKSEYLSFSFLTSEDKSKIYDFAKKSSELSLAAMVAKTEQSRKVLLGDRRDDAVIDFKRSPISYDEYMRNDILKASFIAPRTAIDKAAIDLDQTGYFDNIVYSRSSDVYLELFNHDVNKAAGIEKVLNVYPDLAARLLICIGDFYNDIPMLRMADIAICPHNAVEEVKRICDFVIDNNNLIEQVLIILRSIDISQYERLKRRR